MQPYYQDEHVTIYHGDCREIDLPCPDEVSLVLTDPPYGVAERTNRRSAGRGSEPGKTSSSLRNMKHQAAKARDFAPIHGDNEPFDPSWLLAYKRLVLFGANNFADKLPIAQSWIVWDKLDGMASEKREVGINDNGDLEMAWTNLGGPPRMLRHRWVGMVRASETGTAHLHPTQKPVSLMAMILRWRTAEGDLVLDPYMGSSPVGVACKQLNRRYVGVEIEEAYCEVAAKRLAQGVLFGEAS